MSKAKQANNFQLVADEDDSDGQVDDDYQDDPVDDEEENYEDPDEQAMNHEEDAEDSEAQDIVINNQLQQDLNSNDEIDQSNGQVINANSFQQQQQMQANQNNFAFQGNQIQNNMDDMRMRPQSAKQNDDANQQQFQFLQQNQQMQQQQLPVQNQWIHPSMLQQQQINPQQTQQQYSTNSLQNPQMMMQAAYNNPQSLQGIYQPNMYFPPNAKGTVKKRPGTGGRRKLVSKQANSFGQQLLANGLIKPAVMDLEVSKLRPRVVRQERERLYDDVMRQRMATNYFQEENMKLKTKLHMIDNELIKKDKIIDDLLVQQENYYPGSKLSLHKLKVESHLTGNLKKKIRDLQHEQAQKQDEIDALKRNIKSTRIQEIEIEVKVYMDECSRLRNQLEEVIRSKDTFADPDELKIIEEKFAQKDIIINQMRQTQDELVHAINTKDDENRKLAELMQEMERRLKKAQSNSKANSKFKKEVKEKEKESSKLRKEIMQIRLMSNNQAQLIQDLKLKKSTNTSQISSNQYTKPQQNNSNISQAPPVDVSRYTTEIDQLKTQNQNYQDVIAQLQQQVQQKNDDLAIAIHDKDRFKDLSENYMKENARLCVEVQQNDGEGVERKQKSKLSQRPKDNIKANPSNSNINSKVKKVESKQLTDVVSLLKLNLQKQQKSQDMIHELFFDQFEPTKEVSIGQLKDSFENIFSKNVGVHHTKALLAARFLIEYPQKSIEFVYNEHAKTTQQEVITKLSELIGPYTLYSEDSELEQELQAKFVDTFKNCRQSLIDALQCEDFEEHGILDMSQIRDAITSLDDNIEEAVVDYLLYYAYIRSSSSDQIEYNKLVQLLDQSVKQTNSSGKGSRRRPESSSPDKIKQRNPKQAIIQNEKTQERDNEDGDGDDDDDNDNYDDDDDFIQQDEPKKQDSKPSTKRDNQENDKDDDDDNYDEDEFENDQNKNEGPKMQPQKQPEQQDDQDDDDEYREEFEGEEGDEEKAMIDVAEKVFYRMAELMVQQQITVRQVFQNYIFQGQVQDHILELIPEDGFVEGILALGIDDLSENDVNYLLKVLSKPEFDNSIVLQELLMIMENFGLNDESGQLEDEGESAQIDDSQNNQDDPNKTSSEKKKRSKQLDLSQLDQKSVKIMVMLMLYLLENEITTQDFFQDVIIEQQVRSKTKQQTLAIVKAEDFYRVLQETGIRKKATEHLNLSKFLQLSTNNPEMLLIKNIRRTLEQMAENEAFMDAIREDIMMDDGQQMNEADGQQQDPRTQKNQEEHLDTVGEEDNQTNTQDQKSKMQGDAPDGPPFADQDDDYEF